MKKQRNIYEILDSKGIWFSRLYNVFITAFKFEGMPYDKDIYRNAVAYQKNCLFLNGGYGLINKDGIPLGGIPSGHGGLTWYNSYDKYLLTNIRGQHIVDSKDIALCFNTPSRRPFFDITNWYATMLEEIDKAMQINVRGQNTPPILRSPRGEELSYAKAYEKVAGYEPVVIGGSTLLESSNGQLLYQSPSQYVADSLEMLKHDLLNDYFSIFGATSKSVEKRTVVLKAEVSADMDSKEMSIYTILDEYQYFVDRVNEIFGTNATVTVNSEYVMSELNTYQQENEFIKEGLTPEGEVINHVDKSKTDKSTEVQ